MASPPPLAEMPASWFWSWSKQSIHDNEPSPAGGNGVFIAPGLLLTARHIYPMGRMEIDGVRTFVTGIVDLGGPFGSTENDWVLIRTKVASQPPYPRPHRGPVHIGDRGFVVGYSLLYPGMEAVGPLAVQFEVVETNGLESQYTGRAIAVDLSPKGVIGPGFSGSPAYLFDQKTGEPRLMGTLVGPLGRHFLGVRVSEQVFVAPLANDVIKTMNRSAVTDRQD